MIYSKYKIQHLMIPKHSLLKISKKDSKSSIWPPMIVICAVFLNVKTEEYVKWDSAIVLILILAKSVPILLK